MPVEMAGAVGLDLVGGGQTILRQVAALHYYGIEEPQSSVCAARKKIFHEVLSGGNGELRHWSAH